jgi:hypothetical protein
MVVDAGVHTPLQLGTNTCNLWSFFGHRRKPSTAIGPTVADHRSSRFYRDDAQGKKRRQWRNAVAVRWIKA